MIFFLQGTPRKLLRFHDGSWGEKMVQPPPLRGSIPHDPIPLRFTSTSFFSPSTKGLPLSARRASKMTCLYACRAPQVGGTREENVQRSAHANTCRLVPTTCTPLPPLVPSFCMPLNTPAPCTYGMGSLSAAACPSWCWGRALESTNMPARPTESC